MKSRILPVLAALAAGLALQASSAAATVVYSTSFDSGLPAGFSAPGAVIDGVQGYAGLGPVGRQFGGTFLRYTAVTLFPTKLTVRNLPPHDHLSVKHLLAVIDSWDNTELMQISVDGALKFSHRFSLAVEDTTDYFPAPPGAILSMGHDLGFSGGGYYFRDRAYDLGVEPAFLDIAHTADSVVVAWNISAVSGPAADQWQGGADESWAIDAVAIEVSTQNVGVEQEFAAGGLALEAFPNPSRRGAASVRLALPLRERATLELVDLAGRRLASREVGELGAGIHTLDLGDGHPMTPGVYFARLTQGTSVRVARIAILD